MLASVCVPLTLCFGMKANASNPSGFFFFYCMLREASNSPKHAEWGVKIKCKEPWSLECKLIQKCLFIYLLIFHSLACTWCYHSWASVNCALKTNVDFVSRTCDACLVIFSISVLFSPSRNIAEFTLKWEPLKRFPSSARGAQFFQVSSHQSEEMVSFYQVSIKWVLPLLAAHFETFLLLCYFLKKLSIAHLES